MNGPRSEAAIARVSETPVIGDLPIWTQPVWSASLPWLVQGVTVRGAELGLFGAAPTGAVQNAWRTLRRVTGCDAAVHALQVHGARVLSHHAAEPGLHIADDADGHATRMPGVLLTVAVADCVPVSLLDEEHRAVALLHAGWRGTAAGVLENGIMLLGRQFGASTARLRAHFGPAICGPCYEVGAEVFAALGLPAPAHRAHLDLRAVLADRAIDAGVGAERISISDHCTRCSADLSSHRGGDAGRQMAFLAVRG